MIDKIVTPAVLGLIGVAALTTFFGRKNTAAVIDSIGKAFGGAVTAALGNGGKVA